MNPTDLRLLAVLLQKPYTATALAKLIHREYTYIMQRLMILRAYGYVWSPGMIHYRTRKRQYVVPNSMKEKVLKVLDEETTRKGGD